MQDSADGSQPVGGAAVATTRLGTRTMAMPSPYDTARPPQAPKPALPAPPVVQGLPGPPRSLPGPPAPPTKPRGLPGPPVPPKVAQAPPPRLAGTQSLSKELRACYPARGVIATYMEWVHRLTHAPPQMHLAAILPVIAYEANRRQWQLENGEPLHIWTLIVSPSGVGKTTSLRYAQDIHDTWGMATRGGGWKSPWESAEGSLPGVAEALVGHFDEGNQTTNAILHHSEMSKMLRGDESLEWFCQLFDRGDLKRNLRYLQKRKDDGEEVQDTIRNAKISAIFTTTRASFQEVFREATLRGGFASRLLWFSGSVPPEQLMPMQLVDELGRGKVIQTFSEWTSVLDGMTLTIADREGAHYRSAKVVHLTPEATQLHLEYFDELRPLIVDAREEWNSLGNRAAIYSLRIAALYALVSGHPTIEAEDMTCAINLMRYLFRGLTELLPNLRPEDRFQKQYRRVLEAMKAYAAHSPKIPRSAILQQVRLSVAEFDIIAKTLIEGDVIQEIQTVPVGPGRPTKHYQLVRTTT